MSHSTSHSTPRSAAYSIVCADLSFSWPDGTPVFDGLDVAFGPGRTGLIGVNGSGKSTLLRLIAGELRPASGSVSVAGDVAYLPQSLPLGVDRTVADLLGIARVRRALHEVERGGLSEEELAERFAVIGDDWDVEERARAELDRLGLPRIGLDRAVGTLSGGEAVMVGLAGRLLRRPRVLLLDEPTNNLDLDARHRLYDAVDAWRGVMVVVSHDRVLLEHVDQIADLSRGSVRVFGGTLSAYREALAVEREAAERELRGAGADVRRQRRELAEAETKIARRVRYGDKMYARKRAPKIVMQERKRQAQVSAGKHRELHQDRLDAARRRLAEAEEAVRDEPRIRVELPHTEVPAGRTVIVLDEVTTAAGNPPISLTIRGPERIALLGPNGGGKTTLLRTIVGETPPLGGTVKAEFDGIGYLPQRLDVLDESRSVLENARAFAPEAPVNRIRAGLARFLFRGARADLPASALSGGERFRAVLAALLLAEPPPRLLLLDEPTNNLDMSGVARLTEALAAYRGALVVAGHDLPFLGSIGITRWLRLDREEGLVEIGPPEPGE